MRNSTKLAAVMILSLPTLTSCGTAVPDIADVQDQVSDQVKAQGLDRPDNVSCSGVASISAGTSMVCELIYDDQRNRSAEVGISRVGSDGLGLDVDIIDDRR